MKVDDIVHWLLDWLFFFLILVVGGAGHLVCRLWGRESWLEATDKTLEEHEIRRKMG